MIRIISALLATLALACASPVDPAGATSPAKIGVHASALSGAYPVALGPPGTRYLVDATGAPFLWVGDSAWSLIAQPSQADAVSYLADRQARGFSVILASLIEHKFADHAPADFAGDAPFTGRPFATPNEAYFAHADAVIQAAADRGMVVLLDPLYLGFQCGNEGWCAEVQAATDAELTSWGQYVGSRYAHFDNLVWLIGGDVDPTMVAAKVLDVVHGIVATDTRHLFTAHNNQEQYAITPWPGQPWLGVNDIYSYSGTLYQQAQTAYQADARPFFLVETAYENTHSVTTQALRAQAWWTVIGGGMGWMFGACPMWHFGSDASWCGTNDWQSTLGSPGATSTTITAQLLRARPWHTLVPDTSHLTLTAGAGTSGSASYATCARAADGAFAIAYLPTSRQVTINLARISGTSASVYWYSPRIGTADLAGTFPTTGSRSFTPPSSAGDWVLVIDDAGRGYPAPGPPSAAVDTDVDFEDLSDGSALPSGYGGITWGTGGGGWRAWDGGATYTKTAYVDSTSQSEVTTTFTLPAGKVLKSVKLAVGSGSTATIKFSSAGNPERDYAVTGGAYQTEILGWPVAAGTVTVKITCTAPDGASDPALDDFVYGSP